MELEKKLAQTDLNTFVSAPAKILAKEILKYQKFSPKAALERMNFASFSPSTAKSYLAQGHQYLKDGTYNKRTGFGKVAQFIDQLRNSVSALTPPQGDEYKPRKRKKNAQHNQQPTITVHKAVAATLPSRVATIDLTVAFKYGVRLDGSNQLYLFDSEKECNAFIDGVKLAPLGCAIIVSHVTEQIVKTIR